MWNTCTSVFVTLVHRNSKNEIKQGYGKRRVNIWNEVQQA